jgi:hypothetical protein
MDTSVHTKEQQFASVRIPSSGKAKEQQLADAGKFRHPTGEMPTTLALWPIGIMLDIVYALLMHFLAQKDAILCDFLQNWHVGPTFALRT